VAALDLPPRAQQQLEAGKADLGAARVPEGLDAEAEAAVETAIAESFVGSFRVAMLIAAGLALMSAVAAGILIEGKGRAVRSGEARGAEGETAPA
jgi:hypothetical protein